MTLEEFLKESRDDIEAFKAEWLIGNESFPSGYPMEMEPGDWFDQFITFVTTRNQP